MSRLCICVNIKQVVVVVFSYDTFRSLDAQSALCTLCHTSTIPHSSPHQCHVHVQPNRQQRRLNPNRQQRRLNPSMRSLQYIPRSHNNKRWSQARIHCCHMKNAHSIHTIMRSNATLASRAV